jgi:peptide/nickel transport system substrate-binding protein
LLELIKTGEYNLVAFYSFGLDPFLLNQYFLSDSPDNWTGYANANLDTVLLEAARQSDANTRRGLYAQAQQIIMDDALILPIRDYVNLNGASAAVTGLTFDVNGWFPLLNNSILTEN